MGVSILYDRDAEEACLVDTTSGWAFGPVFSHDAQAKAESFRHWFESGMAVEAARRLGLKPIGQRDGKDAREYLSSQLERLVREWQDWALNDAGELRERAVA